VAAAGLDGHPVSGFLILSFYSVIAGWTLAYVFAPAGGQFDRASMRRLRGDVQGLIGDPERLLAWHTIFMVLTVLVVARGVASGLEKAVRWLMPALFVLLVVMVLYAAQAGDFAAGSATCSTPDFGELARATPARRS
jgi:NSS family neurotransmitter:Na+ symporter